MIIFFPKHAKKFCYHAYADTHIILDLVYMYTPSRKQKCFLRILCTNIFSTNFPANLCLDSSRFPYLWDLMTHSCFIYSSSLKQIPLCMLNIADDPPVSWPYVTTVTGISDHTVPRRVESVRWNIQYFRHKVTAFLCYKHNMVNAWAYHDINSYLLNSTHDSKASWFATFLFINLKRNL